MRTLLLVLAVTLCTTELYAQMILIPKSRLDSIASPRSVVSKVVVEGGKSVDFGRIEEQKIARRVVKLQNKESKSIAVTKLSTTCRCLSATMSSRVICAEKSGEIVLTFNPKGFPGPFEHKVLAYTNLSENQPTAVLTVKGYVIPDKDRSGDYPYHCAGLLLRRKSVNFSSSKVERIACMNGSSKTIKIEKDTLLSSKQITLHAEPEIVKPGQTADIVVTLTDCSEQNMKLYLVADMAPRAREIKIE